VAICAIHQPNFFPWLGYFDKIRRADVFVVMDDVAAIKTGSWTNRVPLAIQGRAAFVGCPMRRWHGMQPICDVRINDDIPWRRKFIRTLEVHYGRARNFPRAMAFLTPLIEHKTDLIAEFNLNAIMAISRLFNIERRFVKQSAFCCAGKGTELLIAITKAVGCDAYMCGGGASGYQIDEMFPASGLGLVYQNFQQVPYGDPEKFIPGLSVIDYLMKAESKISWEAA
jgi:hypothetical protein